MAFPILILFLQGDDVAVNLMGNFAVLTTALWLLAKRKNWQESQRGSK